MREKRDRNNLIIQKLNKGEYAVDIAKEFKISPVMVSKIKKRYLKRVEEKNPDIKLVLKNKKGRNNQKTKPI